MTSPEPAQQRDDLEPPITAVRRAVTIALEEDVLPLGDITAGLVALGTDRTARLVAREAGVVAGQVCAGEAFCQVDSTLRVQWHLGEGAKVGPGSVIGEVAGPFRSILTAERTALNFLCHLSGVATLTSAFVAAAATGDRRCRVWDTRKTTPGLRAVEKAAVRAGGGFNHRGSLSEAVLVKDNHLSGMTIGEAVALARSRWPGRMLEVECDRADQVPEAVVAGATVVMLDNFSPDEASECVALVRSMQRAGSAPAGLLIEASGGVTLDNVGLFAAAGVDVISVGALTHSAPALDIGLDLDAPDSVVPTEPAAPVR